MLIKNKRTMGTDFTDGIIAANGFLISKTDVPTRIGSRIETLKQRHVLISTDEYDALEVKDQTKIYMLYEE